MYVEPDGRVALLPARAAASRGPDAPDRALDRCSAACLVAQLSCGGRTRRRCSSRKASCSAGSTSSSSARSSDELVVAHAAGARSCDRSRRAPTVLRAADRIGLFALGHVPRLDARHEPRATGYRPAAAPVVRAARRGRASCSCSRATPSATARQHARSRAFGTDQLQPVPVALPDPRSTGLPWARASVPLPSSDLVAARWSFPCCVAVAFVGRDALVSARRAAVPGEGSRAEAGDAEPPTDRPTARR